MDANLSCHHDTIALSEDVFLALVGSSGGSPLYVRARGIGSRLRVATIPRSEVVVIRASGPAARGVDLVDSLHEDRAYRWDAAHHEDSPQLSSRKG